MASVIDREVEPIASSNDGGTTKTPTLSESPTTLPSSSPKLCSLAASPPHPSSSAFSAPLINVYGSGALIGQLSTDDSGFCLKDGSPSHDEAERRIIDSDAEVTATLTNDSNEDSVVSTTIDKDSRPSTDSNNDPTPPNDCAASLTDTVEVKSALFSENVELNAVFLTDAVQVEPTSSIDSASDKDASAAETDVKFEIQVESTQGVQLVEYEKSSRLASTDLGVEIPTDWRNFPLVLWTKKEVDDGIASVHRQAEDDEIDDAPSRAATPSWSTEGSRPLRNFEELLALLPCDLRGWTVHGSARGSELALLHSVFDFKTLNAVNDVVVVFERVEGKFKKSTLSLPKDPPQDRSTRHLLDEARGSRDRSFSAFKLDEAYPDSGSDPEARWNFLVKNLSNGNVHKFAGARTLTVSSVTSIMKFALKVPSSLKPEKRKLTDEEFSHLTELHCKKARSDSPTSNGPNQSTGQILECFKCKKYISVNQWSQHPCFKQAVGGDVSLGGGVNLSPSYVREVGPKRGTSRNEHFCKYCKLRFKDRKSLLGHESRFPGGSCNMVINCSICKRKFTSRGSYAIHLQNEGRQCKKGHFRCKVCKSFWGDDLELIDHFRRSHSCSKCRFQPNSFEDFSIHCKSCIRTSNGAPTSTPTGLSCKHCFLIFNSPADLSIHLRNSRSCGGAPAFECCECGITFATGRERAEHERRWHNQRSYQHRCPHCPKNFAAAEMLKMHMSKVHPSGVTKMAPSHDCSACNLKFISFSGLTRHLKMKHGVPRRSTGASGPDDAAKTSASKAPVFETKPVTLKLDESDFLDLDDAAEPPDDPGGTAPPLDNGDLLDDLARPAPEGIALKCGVCFLFFDDAGELKKHQVFCGKG